MHSAAFAHTHTHTRAALGQVHAAAGLEAKFSLCREADAQFLGVQDCSSTQLLTWLRLTPSSHFEELHNSFTEDAHSRNGHLQVQMLEAKAPQLMLHPSTL